ncbi:MAG: hypothetical protein WCT16_02775 [Candidatus Buchananbacteria bacterium]
MANGKNKKSSPTGETEKPFGLALAENKELARLLAELDAAPEEPLTKQDAEKAANIIIGQEAAIQAETAASNDLPESSEAGKAAEEITQQLNITQQFIDSAEDLLGDLEDKTTPVEPTEPTPDSMPATEPPAEILMMPEINQEADTAPGFNMEELNALLNSWETPGLAPSTAYKSIVEIFNGLNAQRLVANREGNKGIAALEPSEITQAEYEAGLVSVEKVADLVLTDISVEELMRLTIDQKKTENAAALAETIEKYARLSGLEEKTVRKIFKQQEDKLLREAQKRLAEGKSFKKEAGKTALKSAAYIGGGIGISLATGGLASFFSPLAIGAIRSADIYLTAKKSKKEEEAKLQEIRRELAKDESAKGNYLEGLFADLAIAKQLQLSRGREGSLADCLAANPGIMGDISEEERICNIQGLKLLERHYNLLQEANDSWLDNHSWAQKAVGSLDKIFLAGGGGAKEKTVTSAALFGIGQALRYTKAGQWGRRVMSGLAGAKLGAVGAQYLSGKKGWGEKIDAEKYIVKSEAGISDIWDKFKELREKKTNLDSKKFKRNTVKIAGIITGALAGAALGEAASAATHKVGSWWQNEKIPAIGETKMAAAETALPVASKIEHSDFVPPKEQLALATIGKGEGIEHALHRQLEANARELGYTGSLDNRSALHHWAGIRAHQIAIAEHYVDPQSGAEIRVAGAGTGHAQYVLDEQGRVHEFLDGGAVEAHAPLTAKEFEYVANEPAVTTETATTETAGAAVPETPISGNEMEKILSGIDNKYPGSAELLRNAATETAGETAGQVNREELAGLADYFYHHQDFKPSTGLIELVSSHSQQTEKLLELLDHPEVAGNAKLIELVNANDIFSNQKNIADWLEVLHGSTVGRSQGVDASLERIFQTNGLAEHYRSQFNMPDFRVAQTHVSAFTGDITFKTPAPINLGLTKGQTPLIDWLYDPSKNSFRAMINFRGQLIGENFAAKPGESDPNKVLARTFEALLDKLKGKISSK